MNLKDDLLRNRTVFRRLTGESADNSDADIKRTGIIRDMLSDDAVQRSSLKIPGYDEPPETPRTVFSLKYGQDTPPLSFEAPDAVGYPVLSDKRHSIAQNPLESLYYQLEVEARRGSQLAGEEEFYG